MAELLNSFWKENRMKIYILDQRKDNEKHNATGKAMTDVFTIVGSCKVKTMPGVPKDAGKALKILDLFILTFYSVFVLGRKDYCIFVYQDNAVKIKLLNKLKKFRRFKVICMVNDVNSIRSDGLYSEKRKADIDNDFNLIGLADIILAPNKGSIAYMTERGMKSQMIPVGVWDYLMDDLMGQKCDENAYMASCGVKPLLNGNANAGDFITPRKWKIGFAGNLGKSQFLDGIPTVVTDKVEYHLWGDTEGKEFKNNGVIYEGSVSPNVLPLEISEKCNFGLVWDGTRVDKIEGGYGEYLRFNNSHKCGCYLASGIPVFVWKQSGMAHFVEETGCGFAIDNLNDIANVLSTLSQDKYDELLSSVKKVSEKIREGFYLKSALNVATKGALGEYIKQD